MPAAVKKKTAEKTQNIGHIEEIQGVVIEAVFHDHLPEINHAITVARASGAEEVKGAVYSGLGKSFFLTDLIKKVIIGEAAWVSTDRAAVRRAFILKAIAFTGIFLLTLGAAAVWWISYQHNAALVDRTQAAVKEYQAAAGPLPREAKIGDRDFAKILPILHRLRNLPTGYATRSISTPVQATFGLSQRERLQSSSEIAYHMGLERMFRPRLIYRLEELLEANRTNPSFLYEALKVYLMLGGLHQADRGLIVSWMARDWADNLYPGAGAKDGRNALEEHLNAMLDLDEGEEPLFTLHGPLVTETQKALARLSVAQRAYELLKSQARTPDAPEWVAALSGGSDMAAVFEAQAGTTLEDIKVAGFYTYAGFHRNFLPRLSNIADQLKAERWVLGEAGEQAAVSEQYDRLADDLLQIYTRDFIATWRDALGKLRLKRLTADKPKYFALIALAAATSPMKRLLESIRDETALTRERPGFGKGDDKNKDSKSVPTLVQTKERVLGANIEAAFKPFHVVVEGDGARKPIDALIANLGDIAQSLALAANTPSQIAQANASLQVQLTTLKNNAALMPPPFADMMRTAASEFEGDLAKASARQLSQALGDQVTRLCQQTVTNFYPFVRGSERDVPLAEFGKLFAPGGALDNFFKQNLGPITDTSKRDWAFRPDSRVASTLNAAALREFQRAAAIRDAFFPTGGNQPSISLGVIPPPLPAPSASGGNIGVKMEINGAVVESKAGSNSAVAVQWPGAAAVGRTAITVTPEAPAAGGVFGGTPPPPPAPAVLERTGAWSLFRMLDAGAAAKRGDRMVARYIVGGRELTYQFTISSLQNPFSLPALREFRCPTGL